MKIKSKKIIGVLSCLVILAGLFTGCESINREIKTFKSDASGGLYREITIFTMTGDVIAKYRGKTDIEMTEGGKVLFDLDGKRYIYYNCYIEAVEIDESEGKDTYVSRVSDQKNRKD